MKFDYLQRITVDAQLDVDNLGEVCILARNDWGEEWYLIIHTVYGWTEVIEYGPANPSISLLPASVKYTYDRFEYNQGKLIRKVETFLNDGKRAITYAEVTSLEMIEEFIVNPVQKVFHSDDSQSGVEDDTEEDADE